MKQIIVDSLRIYRDKRIKLQHDYDTAHALGFEHQKGKIMSDLRWTNEIIELLRLIEEEK